MGRTSDLTESQVAVLKSLSVNGIKQVEIAAQLAISQSAVSKCLQKYGQQSTKLWPEKVYLGER